jgi:hypothetical protein
MVTFRAKPMNLLQSNITINSPDKNNNYAKTLIPQINLYL